MNCSVENEHLPGEGRKTAHAFIVGRGQGF